MWAGPQETIPGSQGPQSRERLAVLKLTKDMSVSGRWGRRGPGAPEPGRGAAGAPSPFPTASQGPAAAVWTPEQAAWGRTLPTALATSQEKPITS